MKQAVILAGGKGTRLRSVLGELPKPLVDLCGQPLLYRQLTELEKYGFDEVLILAHYKAEVLAEYIAKRVNKMNIRVLVEPHPMGSGGALQYHLEHLDDRFLVVYGDVYFDVDLKSMWEDYNLSDAVLAVHPNTHPHDPDLVDVDDSGYIRSFSGYPHTAKEIFPNLVNAGLVILRKKVISELPKGIQFADLAKDFFPKWISDGKRLLSYRTVEYIKDIGTPERLNKAISDITSGFVASRSGHKKRKAIFLDRDGTIIKDVGHLNHRNQISLLPGAAEAIKDINASEFLSIIVTNQPVIARGELSFEGLKSIHNVLDHLLGEKGAYLDYLYYCPHHPESGFDGEVAELKIACCCRKPESGMLRFAESDFNLELNECWMVGDSLVDQEAALGAGVKFAPVRSFYFDNADEIHTVIRCILRGEYC